MGRNRIDCKVVLLGKEYGGKTSLLERFLHNRFKNELPYQNTIGAAFGAKHLTSRDKKVTLGIWDTAGSERYEAMSRIYYRDAKAAIVCYDITEAKSFEKVRFWVNELLENEESCKVYLAGTKLDLVLNEGYSRAIDYHDVRDYSDEIGAVVMETSSKTGENVQNLFKRVADDFSSDLTNFSKLDDVEEADFINLQNDSVKPQHKRCCRS